MHRSSGYQLIVLGGASDVLAGGFEAKLRAGLDEIGLIHTTVLAGARVRCLATADAELGAAPRFGISLVGLQARRSLQIS